jgi:putative PIG3 family NAD(P)H quinone oxidoreductase
MKAIEITSPGGPEVLKPTTRPVPTLGADEVLIEVAAAGINRPDVLQRQGNYAPPPGASDLPGLEVAGKVVAVSGDVTALKPGDLVCALVAGGGYAEYCAAPVAQCLPIPAGMSLVEAAALPETFFTVWTNIVDGGKLASGETFLVHGGSSGIGTTAIQLARMLGARVFATAGDAEKCRACEELGAERAINYKTEDFVEVVKQATDKRGVDVVLDMVGGDYVPRNIEIMAPHGRHVSIAFLRGPKTQINLEPVMRKRLVLTGSTLRPRSVAEKGEIARALHERVWPKLADGSIKPVIYKTFPLDEAAAGHALMESSKHTGKIMLEVRRG